MTLYPSFTIGQRNNWKGIVEQGRYKGNKIYDGVVYDSSNTPIAYSILTDNKDEDYFYSAKNAQLLFEPEEGNMLRGVSLIAASLVDALNVQDTNDNISRTIKILSKFAIKVGTKTGTGEDMIDGYGVGAQEATTGTTAKEQPVIYDGADFTFLDAKNNESMESFEPKQPGDSIPEWLRGIEEKALYNLGWHLALVSPGSIGSYAARIMESQVQQMVANRQQTLKRIAKLYCISAIARAIENKELPTPKGNSNDWRKIDFKLPPLFQIDSYYGAQTAMQQWTTGNDSLENITAKQGLDWKEIRNAREMEADDALERAARLAKKYNISTERALDLISKQTVNASPVQEVTQTQ